MKNRSMKKLLAMLLVLVLCASLLPAAAFAEEGEEAGTEETAPEAEEQETAEVEEQEETEPAEPEADEPETESGTETETEAVPEEEAEEAAPEEEQEPSGEAPDEEAGPAGSDAELTADEPENAEEEQEPEAGEPVGEPEAEAVEPAGESEPAEEEIPEEPEQQEADPAKMPPDEGKNAARTADDTPPSLSNFTLNKTSVTVPGSITVTATASDDSSGVDYLEMYFHESKTDSTLYVRLDPNSSGKYTGTITVDQNTYGGTYEISSVFVYDKAGNCSAYYGSGWGDGPSNYGPLPSVCYSRSFTVTNDNPPPVPDTMPPELSNFTLSAESVTIPGSITVTATASDDSSGVDYLELYFHKFGNDTLLNVRLNPNGTGKCTGTLRVNKDTESGKYEISSVFVYDKKGKCSAYYGSGWGDGPSNYGPLPSVCYSRSFYVIDPDAAPEIVTNPGSKTVIEGNTAKFGVKAMGADMSYQWQFKTGADGTWKTCTETGSKTATLSVTAALSKSGYRYRCKVTSAGGTRYSSVAILTVKPAVTHPAITTHPSSKYAANGDVAKFGVKATGGDLTYQWQYRIGTSGAWTSCTGTGSKTATLSVTAALSKSGYRYRCKVTNAAGTVYSNVAILTVVTHPEITSNPGSKTVTAGTVAKFGVKAKGGGLSFQWQYKTGASGTWTNCPGAAGKTAMLSLTATTGKNGYRYRCKVTNAAGTCYSSVVILTVKPDLTCPEITTNPASKTVTEGTVVKFGVKATGSNLHYQWQYRTGTSGTWMNFTGTGGTSAVMSVNASADVNGYQYHCKVSNGSGTVYSTVATLTVTSG